MNTKPQPALLHWPLSLSKNPPMKSHRYPLSRPALRSAFAGYRFPPEIITLAVRWYLRFGLSYRDVEELLAERGIEVFLSPRRNREAAGRLFAQAISRTLVSPTEVTTDRYRVYPRVLDELLPAAFHDTEVHANNPLETDHGRLKARLRPMRGLKCDRTARVIVGGHAFVQNLRRGFYDLGTDVRPTARLADAFAELALVI